GGLIGLRGTRRRRIRVVLENLRDRVLNHFVRIGAPLLGRLQCTAHGSLKLLKELTFARIGVSMMMATTALNGLTRVRPAGGTRCRRWRGGGNGVRRGSIAGGGKILEIQGHAVAADAGN